MTEDDKKVEALAETALD